MNIHMKLALGASLVLAACGGNSDGPTRSSIMPPPPNQLVGGLWYGTLTSDSSMATEEFLGMVSENGRFLFLTGSLAQFSGTMTVDGETATGSGRGFAGAGGTWPDGSTVGDLSITATIDGRSSLSGAFSLSSMESGTFDLIYDPDYEQDSSLDLLDGLWIAYDDFGNPAVTFAVEDTGSFNGQNTQGCMSNGQFSIIDARFALYAVESTVSNCPIAGDYTGLAVLVDIVLPNDALLFAVNNGDTAILLGFQK